jgi:hypothetical protein
MRQRLMLLGLVVLVWSGLGMAQAGGGFTASPLPPNAPAIPTTIKNQPFSADVITQYDRVLENGNHIHRETRGRVFRDGQGRVRTETQFAGADRLQHITIQDPVQRIVVHLDPRNKVATIHHLSDVTSANASTAVGAKDNIAPSRAGNALMMTPPGSGVSNVIPLQHADPSIRPSVRTEALGTRPMERTVATGTRTTRTIDNGDGPAIVCVSEIWYAHDLQIVLLSETDDGQAGRSMMKLENLSRVEPSAQLFQIPTDYAVKDSNPDTASAKPLRSK